MDDDVKLHRSTYSRFQELLKLVDKRHFRIDRIERSPNHTEWAVTRLRRRGLFRTDVKVDIDSLTIARKDNQGYHLIDSTGPDLKLLLSNR